MATIPTLIYLLLLLFMSPSITQSNLYPNCATNDTQSNPQTCHIELSECMDASCTDLTANSQIYCPNNASCSTICKSPNLCTYISSQFEPSIYPYTNSISSIYCTTNSNPTACQLTKDTPNPTQSTIYLSTTSSNNNDLVIRLDQNTVWTIIVLTIICLFGCIICCIARTFWKFHKKTAIPPHRQNHHDHNNENHHNDNAQNINKQDMKQEIHIAMTQLNNNISKQNESLTSTSSPSVTASNGQSKTITIKHPKHNHQSEPPPIIYNNYPHKIALQSKRSMPPNYVQPPPHKKHQYSQRRSYPQKKNKKAPIKYHNVRMANLERHQIRNVTMIGDGERINIKEIIGTHTYIDRDARDSLDSDDDIGPHIINDEESYMHSLTLAQVENATAAHKDYDELQPRHEFIDGVPEIFPHHNNKRKMMVSNPFHIESHRSERKSKSKNIIDFIASLDEESMNVQITPRTPMHLDLSANTVNTAIVHVSRGTFEHSQSQSGDLDIDISTLKISANKHSNEDDMQSHDSNVLKRKLSQKLKKLQKQQGNGFENDEEETISVTSRHGHALGHESGASPSDLQQYFARLAISKQHNNKHELAMASPTMTHPTCKSSTATETFYYKENDLNVEHHILMPALDEKDSADYEKSTRSKKTHTNTNELEMNVVIDNTKEMMVDEKKANLSMITPQLLSKPSEIDHIYMRQMKVGLEVNENEHNMSHNNLYIASNASNNEINIDDIELNTASIMSSTTPLEYRTSDEDVLNDKNSVTS